MINLMKPSIGSVSLEQMNEASKLFSASFQKDSAHQRNDSSDSGQMTTANFIDAIITRQINTDSIGSTKSSAQFSSTTATSLALGTTDTTALAPFQTVTGGSGSPGNFSISQFHNGLKGGGGGQPLLVPPVTTTGLKLLSRQSSTFSGNSFQSYSVIKMDGEAEEKLAKQGPTTDVGVGCSCGGGNRWQQRSGRFASRNHLQRHQQQLFRPTVSNGLKKDDDHYHQCHYFEQLLLANPTLTATA